ncbi:MAG: SPASM domain-containing protein [Fibrobacterota bacterium]
MGDPLEKGILGDLRKESVTQAWNNARYRAFRRDIVQGNWADLKKRNHHCGTCNWNFSLKSQSMGGLCMVSRAAVPGPSGAKTDLIFTAADTLRAGFKRYLRGELAESLKDFTMAEIIAQNKNARATARAWKENVIQVFKMRKDVEIWENTLQKEGLSLDKVHMSYYWLSESQEKLTLEKHTVLEDGSFVKKQDF